MKNYSKHILVGGILLLTLLLSAGSVLAAGNWILTKEGVKVWDPAPQQGETATWSGNRDANGCASGNGVLNAYVNNLLQVTYEGPMVAGKVTGKGKLTAPSGASYTGNLVDWSFEGQGIYRSADGSYYQGNFANNQYNGNGVANWADGASYEGSFVNGLPDGKGTFKMTNGTTYRGDMVKGQISGQGRITYADATYYIGTFLNGQPSGYGTLYKTDGSVINQGNWSNGKFSK